MNFSPPEEKVSQNALSTLAYINISWNEERRSYLDNFTPFLLEALRRLQVPSEPSEISQKIGQIFGLNFPIDVVKNLIDRAVRTKQVQRLDSSNEVILADGVSITLPQLKSQQRELQVQQSELIKALSVFVSERFAESWSVEQAEVELFNFVEQYALPLLGTSLSARSERLPNIEGSEYIIASFFDEVVSEDSRLFTFFEQLVKGTMLASALYLNGADQSNRKFEKTTLYLDTPILLQLLGLEGKAGERAAKETVQLAKDQQAGLACFRHTIREMRGVIDGAKRFLGRTQGGESSPRGVAKHFIAEGLTINDVDIVLATFEEKLEHLGVRIVSTPEHEERYTVDELRLEDVLQETVGYMYPTTRASDLDSLTSIHRLRRGGCNARIETAPRGFRYR